jgi:hypothetical protein
MNPAAGVSMIIMIDIKRLLSLGFTSTRGTYMNSMTEARRRTGRSCADAPGLIVSRR